MAWYSLYKWFIQFRKKPYSDWVYWYKQHLYDEWFNSLSNGEQKAELERQQRIREKERHDGEMALARLGVMYNMMNELTHGEMGNYMEAARFVNRISNHPSKYY